MHIIIGLAGLWATLVATRSHMPNGFTGFFHPAALILLLGAPPSILLVGHDVREIWAGIVTLAQALRYHARRAEARMIAATCGGIRVVSLYAPNGRALDTPFYGAKLAWFERLRAWLQASATPDDALVVGGDLNVAPTDLDVYDPAEYVGTTHTSPPERAAFQALLDWGLVDTFRLRHPEGGRFTWWDYRASNFHKGLGMPIAHLLATRPVAARVVTAEVDRDARKGPTPSDHAPLWIDLADG